jgi:hypothetical protein
MWLFQDGQEIFICIIMVPLGDNKGCCVIGMMQRKGNIERKMESNKMDEL